MYYRVVDHDAVVRTSATTYAELEQQGYVVSTNLTGATRRMVGRPENPYYPDLIVWKPSTPSSSTGTVYIIEEIETEESVSYDAGQKWKAYGELGINKFILIVPLTKVQLALRIVKELNCNISEIWYYDVSSGVIVFNKYVELSK